MVDSKLIYTLIILAVSIERLFELRLAKRNARWSFARGGKEFGQGHYPFMVILHTGFLLACLAEVWFYDRPFAPGWGAMMFILAILGQGLRWWVISTLGPRWNTRVIVVPGGERISTGPFRYLPHPNYLAVVAEGMALPLIHQAWVTAIVFTVLNFCLLRLRIRCEERALAFLTGSSRPAACKLG